MTADQARGQFHGLIAVPGDESVLETAAHAGSQPGCGDCVWDIVIVCARNGVHAPNEPDDCSGAPAQSRCGQTGTQFRVFLTTATEPLHTVDVVCLNDIHDIVPVGDIARQDVERYLQDVTPPLLDLHLQPANGVPANLPAYFWVRTPQGLQPQPFGGPTVRETITIKPERYQWTWGDGSDTGWITDAGAPYPHGTLTHTYATANHYPGDVTAEWGGTYTITVAGQTFGPYDAIGTVTRTQQWSIDVLSARRHLISHG